MSGLVYRQVHKKHVDELLQPASMVFNPFVTGGQEGKRHRVLSAYDGDQISAKDAHRHFTRELGLTSAGVLAVSVQECEDTGDPSRLRWAWISGSRKSPLSATVAASDRVVGRRVV